MSAVLKSNLCEVTLEYATPEQSHHKLFFVPLMYKWRNNMELSTALMQDTSKKSIRSADFSKVNFERSLKLFMS